MGIKRLFSLLSPLFETVNISELGDITIGVDGMAWLYQSFFCNYDSSENEYIGILRQLERKINIMKKMGVKVS